MTDNRDLCVEVRHQDIVVTMPDTSFRVVYRKPHRGSQLVARLDYFQDQQKGPITRAEFLARALKAANDKAASWVDCIKGRASRRGSVATSDPLTRLADMLASNS